MNTINCPNCGAEIALSPKIVYDKDGIVVHEPGRGVPMRDEKGRFVGMDFSKNNGCTCKHGISLAGEEYDNDNDGEHNDDEPLCERVRKQGPVKNHRLFRRWINMGPIAA